MPFTHELADAVIDTIEAGRDNPDRNVPRAFTLITDATRLTPVAGIVLEAALLLAHRAADFRKTAAVLLEQTIVERTYAILGGRGYDIGHSLFVDFTEAVHADDWEASDALEALRRVYGPTVHKDDRDAILRNLLASLADILHPEIGRIIQPGIATPYEDLLRDVLANGSRKTDRTGTGTRSVFGRQLRFDLADGFPLITTKKVHFKSIAYELLWFLRGDGNVNWLRDHGVTIWDEWADENGDLGPVYGVQWRSWPTPDGGHIDQIAEVIEAIKTNPDSRRHVVTAWNPAELDNQALPPCHALFQFYVADGRLSCQLYQRSADLFLGVPFNIASYALLTHLVAAQTGLEVGEFVWTGGDCHIYDNHVAQVTEQLTRDPYPAPTLELAARDSIFDYEFEDLTIHGYQSHPAIRGAVAV